MTYQGDEKAYRRMKQRLDKMDDLHIDAMYEHVRANNFHADTEFSKFGIEGKVPIDEFIDALTQLKDERSRRKVLATA